MLSGSGIIRFRWYSCNKHRRLGSTCDYVCPFGQELFKQYDSQLTAQWDLSVRHCSQSSQQFAMYLCGCLSCTHVNTGTTMTQFVPLVILELVITVIILKLAIMTLVSAQEDSTQSTAHRQSEAICRLPQATGEVPVVIYLQHAYICPSCSWQSPENVDKEFGQVATFVQLQGGLRCRRQSQLLLAH